MKQKELLAQLECAVLAYQRPLPSKLEVSRTVTDIRLLALCEILDVDVF